jgi:hypothetical protein
MLKTVPAIILLMMLLVSFLANVNTSLAALPQSRTITGFLCYSDSGAKMGTDCIQTKNGKVCYATQAAIKYVGFKSRRAHEMGAKYRVTLDSSGDYASKIVFTGRVKPTQRCESR